MNVYLLEAKRHDLTIKKKLRPFYFVFGNKKKNRISANY